jgi:hypothetical protein
MKKNILLCYLLLACAALPGCAGITQMQDATSTFDEGAHNVSTAQIAFDRSIQADECRADFYAQAYGYARSKNAPIDLGYICQPQILTDRQIAIRQDLLDAMTLYADQIAAMASSNDSQDLSRNAQDLAGKINARARAGGLADLSISAAVESAVIGLTEIVIDQARVRDIRAAAKAQKDNLKIVITALEHENETLASAVPSDKGQIRAEFAAILSASRNTEGPAVFFHVIETHDILNAIPEDANDTKTALNAALDSLETANEAIANSATGDIVAAVKDLVAKAQEARATQAALNN